MRIGPILNTHWTRIPEAKRAAVEKALQSAFHTTQIDDLAPLTGGLSSALVYRITVLGRPYVLRLMVEIDAFRDPARQMTCMTIAAEAGIAPCVRYACADDALSIIDFIDAVPLSSHFPSPMALLPEIVKTVKAIHAAPLFPKLVGYLDGIDIFIQQFQDSKMLPERATEECFRRYAAIQEAYPRHDPDLVSSHNDLNPNNLLFDGQKIWVIDWESAFQNDRYVDLAVMARSFVRDETQEELYLKAYFGEALDDGKRARFFLMQQVCHLFYGLVMLKMAAASRPVGFRHDAGMETPSLRDIHAQVGSGQTSLATYEGQLLYGKASLNQAVADMKTSRFAESLRQVRVQS